jgi:GNAT superfamily N-acetyltransferase
MTSPSVVRAAVPQDEPELWRMLRILCAENGMFSISDRKVQTYLTRLLHPKSIATGDTGPRGVIGVIGPVGALEACIMLTIGSVWYSEDWTLDEHLNFVDPEHRRSEHAKALISYAKHCADQIGIRLVIGVLSTKRTAAKVRLYERQLTPAGAFFVHPAPPDVHVQTRRYRTQ